MIQSCSILKRKTYESIMILKDIDNLLNDEEFDNSFISLHLLNKLVQLTESEFGFIMLLDHNHLYGHTITDFAWNKESQFIMLENISSLKIHINHPSFRDCINNRSSTIVKDPVSFLPEGHPNIKHMLCVPIIDDTIFIGLLCVCNKFDSYSKKDIKNSECILNSSNEIIKNYICK